MSSAFSEPSASHVSGQRTVLDASGYQWPLRQGRGEAPFVPRSPAARRCETACFALTRPPVSSEQSLGKATNRPPSQPELRPDACHIRWEAPSEPRTQVQGFGFVHCLPQVSLILWVLLSSICEIRG